MAEYIWDMTNEEIQAIYEKEKERKYKAEGAKENARNIACNLLGEQMPPEAVARCTGLPLEEVETLAG